jgi:hypothetical protein
MDSKVQLTIDRQVVQQRCAACATTFTVVRGSVFDGRSPIGLYLVALHGHGHAGKGRLAHLAISLLDQERGQASGPPAIAAAMDAVADEEQFEISLVDWKDSPWKDESYLGQMLDRAAALGHSQKSNFFQIADRILEDVPEVVSYFG